MNGLPEEGDKKSWEAVEGSEQSDMTWYDVDWETGKDLNGNQYILESTKVQKNVPVFDVLDIKLQIYWLWNLMTFI